MADGIFGPTPDAIRRAQQQQNIQQSFLIGRMGPTGIGALAGLQTGQGLFQADNPELRKAQEFQRIEQESMEQGLEPGTPEFTKWVTGQIRSRIGLQESLQAFEMATQAERQRAEVNALRQAPEAAQRQNLVRQAVLRSLGMDPDQAALFAEDPKVFEAQYKELIKAVPEPDRIRSLRILAADPELRKLAAEMKRAGATNVSITNQLGPGGKKFREGLGTELAGFAANGASDSAKQIEQLGTAIADLESGVAGTGPVRGLAAQSALIGPIVAPEDVAVKERVEEVVQRNLKAVLGAQFTEREGERLISRAYNPRLPVEENIRRLKRLQAQMIDAHQRKQAAAEYLLRNGTLDGWEGRLPSIGDFDPSGGAAPSVQMVDPRARDDRPPPDVDPADWQFMTPEEKALFR